MSLTPSQSGHAVKRRKRAGKDDDCFRGGKVVSPLSRKERNLAEGLGNAVIPVGRRVLI